MEGGGGGVVIVFTIKDSMENDLLYVSLLINNTEMPVNVGQESTLPGSDNNDLLYSSQASPGLL